MTQNTIAPHVYCLLEVGLQPQLLENENGSFTFVRDFLIELVLECSQQSAQVHPVLEDNSTNMSQHPPH